MSILLLTGPPASGKNTVAEQLAKRLDRCAVIDADIVRRMVVQPHKYYWEGDEGHAQWLLGIDNASALARNFDNGKFDVVISDTLSSAAVARYKERLAPTSVTTYQLLPTEAEIAGRLLSRPDYLSRGQVELLYSQQASFTEYDDKLDNTKLSIAQAVDWVLERWSR